MCEYNSGPLYGCDPYKVGQSVHRAGTAGGRLECYTKFFTIAYLLTRADDANIACLEERSEKHSPAAPFS